MNAAGTGLGRRSLPEWAWVLLAAAVAALLAGSRLSDPGLWCDEIYTARWTGFSLTGLLDTLRHDLHPPLYFLLQNAVVAWAGDTESGLRLFALVTAVLTVPAAWWAFRPMLPERLALATAWLLALCPQFFLYGRMARYYALAALLAMVAHGLFARLALQRGRPRSWLLYGLSVAALLYTSYVAVCLVLAHLVWAVAAKRRRPRLWSAWIAAAGGGAVLFLPWCAALVQQVRHAQGLLPSVVSGPFGLLLMLAYDLVALTGTELQAPWTAFGALGVAAGTAALALGVLAAIRRGLGRSVLLPALAALALAWLVVGTLAHATPFVGLPARTLFMWPFAAAVLAIAVLDPVYPRILRGTLLAALLASWAAGWVQLHRAEGWMNPIYLTPGREVAADLAPRLASGDAVLSEDDTGVNHYLARAAAGVPVVDPVVPQATHRLLSAPEVRVIWYVKLMRDGSQRVRGEHGAEGELAAWGQVTSERGWLAIDPMHQRIKHAMTGLSGHTHRVVVQRWERRPTPVP